MKSQTRNYIIALISITAVFAVQLLPLNLTEPESVTLGIFIMALLLWMTEAIPLYVTSLLILLFEAVLLTPELNEAGIKTSHKIFLAPFFSDVVALFLGGLLLARAGSRYHIDEWVAGRVIKFAGKKPSILLLALMATTAFLSMWMSNTATTAMMLIIAMVIVENIGEESIFTKALFLGIPFAANIGGMGTPVGTPPNAIAIGQINKWAAESNFHQITFLEWMIAAVPLVLLLLVILWRILLFFYPAPDEEIELKGHNSYFKFNISVAAVMVIFTVTIVLWLTTKLHGVSSGMVALFPAVALLGSGLLNKGDFKSISWDVLFLVAGGGALSIAMSRSGLTETLMSSFDFASLETIMLLVVFLIAGGIMTSFMSNTATANIIIPIIFVIQGIQSTPIAMATALAISATMVLPVSTPPNALAYSSGRIELKEMLKVGIIITIISAVTVITAGYQWWRLIGLFE